MVGSEGTLGVVTEAHLKIIPLPSVPTRRLLVTFREWSAAGKAVGGCGVSRVVPSLLEFMDREVIAALNERTGSTLDEAEATMLVDVDEPRLDEATAILESCGASGIRVAKDDEEAETLYQIRAMAFLAIKNLSSGVYAEDVTVPIDRLEEYFHDVKELAKKYGLRIPHERPRRRRQRAPAHTLRQERPKERETANRAVEEMCSHAVAMGGSISGEHGVGIQKVSLFREQMLAHDGEESLRLMKEVKKVFDPEGIMNPGKYVEAA